jgi:hypothetical protein
MTLSYFYLLGQAISVLIFSWYFSLFYNCLIALILTAVSGFHDFSPFMVLVGWLSVIRWNFTSIAQCTALLSTVNTHSLIIMTVIELLLFALVTLLVAVNDMVGWTWLLLTVFHVLLLLCFILWNSESGRIQMTDVRYNYHLLYLIGLAVTDLAFMVISLLASTDRIPFLAVVFVAAVTFVSSFLFHERLV